VKSQAALDAQAQALRAQGLKYREIGERMGESKKQAWTRCNREREREHTRRYKAGHREQIREYDHHFKRENRAECPRCGHIYGIGSGTKNGPAQRISFANCPGCAQEKRERIAELWHQGASTTQIAAEIGTTAGTVRVEIARMREDGWDLPYRRPQAKGSKHPELVA
jgi:transposase